MTEDPEAIWKDYFAHAYDDVPIPPGSDQYNQLRQAFLSGIMAACAEIENMHDHSTLGCAVEMLIRLTILE